MGVPLLVPPLLATAPQSTHTAPKLTAQQKEALAKLDQAAQAFEGVFLEMVMKAMRSTVPQTTIFGRESASEQTWQSMLDSEYAQNMAKSGGLGLAHQLEQQLRARVLGDASRESRVQVQGRLQP